MWTIAWDTHAFVHQPLSIFDANIFYPNRHSLAYSENLIGSAFFAAPVLWLTGNPVLAVNVVSLLSCVLCGLGAYVLGRRVGLSPAAAAADGHRLRLLAAAVFSLQPASSRSRSSGFRSRWRRFTRIWRVAGRAICAWPSLSSHSRCWPAVTVACLRESPSSSCWRTELALGEPVLRRQAPARFRSRGRAAAGADRPVRDSVRVDQVEVGLRRSLATAGTPLTNFLASPTPVDRFLQSLVTDKDPDGEATAWLFPGSCPFVLALVAVAGSAAALGHSHQETGAGGAACEDMALDGGIPTTGVRFVCFLIAGLSWAFSVVIPPLVRAGAGLTAQDYGNDRVVWSRVHEHRAAGPLQLRHHMRMGSRGCSSRTRRSSTALPGRPEAPRTGSVTLHRGISPHLPGAPPTATDAGFSGPGHVKATRGVTSRCPPARCPGGRSSESALVLLARARRLASRHVRERGRVGRMWCVCAVACPPAHGLDRVGRPVPPQSDSVLLAADRRLSGPRARGRGTGLWQFVYWLPGFNFIREPSRFMLLGLLGVAVLAGMGFDWLSARLAPSRLASPAVVVGGLLVAEFSMIPFKATPYRLEIPAVDLWVARPAEAIHDRGGPGAGSERYHSNYMLHSMAHWQKTVHGYSGIRPALHDEAVPATREISERRKRPASCATRRDIRHRPQQLVPPEERGSIEERLPAFGSSLKLEYMDADSRVYSVHRP